MSFSALSGSSVARSSWHLVIALSLCMGIQAITTDLYLPGLPQMTEDLGTSVSKTQLTLSLLLVFFGIGQLIAGPLSDRYGRRPVLLVSLFFYSLFALIGGMVDSIEALITCRALQGLFMSGAVVCARALPRDLYSPPQAANLISKGLTGLGLIACMSPLVGVSVVNWLGWRGSLLALFAFGVITFLWIFLFQKETLQVSNRNSFHLKGMYRNWSAIARNRQFQAYTSVSSFSYGALFVFLASSSFVFTKVWGLTSSTYGLWLVTSSLSYIAGTFICRFFLKRRSIQSTLKIGGSFALLAAVLMTLISVNGWSGVTYFIPVHFLFMISHGINLPCSTAGAVGPFPDKAGAAAALSGFIMMIIAFITGLFLGKFISLTEPSFYPLTLGMAIWSWMSAFSSLILVQRSHN